MDENKIKRNLTAAALILVLFTVFIPLLLLFWPYGDADFFDGTADLYDLEVKKEAIFADGIRGVYIATVDNINYPSTSALNAYELAAELDDILVTVKEAGFNAIFFQVRPCADALYASNLFPTSKYLSGEQGQNADENFDPLDYLIEKAHSEGITVHAWINPLRVTNGSQNAPQHDLSKLAKSNPAVQHPDWVVCYDDGKMYFDIGYPAVTDLISAGIAELLSCYELDGVMFDDYFYPYPVYVDGKIAEFDDSVSYSLYGNGLSLDDWRRQNVNNMIKTCYNTVKELASECLFGVAPFGIWANDDGENGGSDTSGLSAYDEIYCDAVSWIEGGYVDYIAPQIYWGFESDAAPYDVLIRWWSDKIRDSKVKLLVSIGAYRYATGDFSFGELTEQLEYASENKLYGSIIYGYEQIKANVGGVAEEAIAAFSGETIAKSK